MGLAKLPANHTETPPVRTPFPPQILKSMACERAQQYAPLHTYSLARGEGPAILEARGRDRGRSQRDGCVFPPFSWTKATT